MTAIAWDEARETVYRAAAEEMLPAWQHKPGNADGMTLAAPLTSLTPLPAFTTSSVDGYAVRGEAPWRLAGRVLAGQRADKIRVGEAIEVATGAMVPDGTEAIIRLEDATVVDGEVSGQARKVPEWRDVGEEAPDGAELLPVGTAVTPGVIGLAASCGYDFLEVRPKPRVAVLVFGDELAVEGAPGEGTV
ncbi:MAG: molybdopterin molybdenumtransferase MoeA, partial [Stackebrandtia sp.]